jgi:hypothetical protein
VIALAIVVGVVALLAGHDAPTTDAPTAVPGHAVPAERQGPPADRRLLAAGDVLVRAGAAELRGARALAADVAGPADAAAVRSGQAVVVRPSGAAGVRALAVGRELRVATASDPALRAFLEYWLGRGSAG